MRSLSSEERVLLKIEQYPFNYLKPWYLRVENVLSEYPTLKITTIGNILFEDRSFLRLVRESADTHHFETELQHFFKPTCDSFAAAHILSSRVCTTSCALEQTYNVYWRHLKFGWCYSTNLFLDICLNCYQFTIQIKCIIIKFLNKV